MNYDTLIDYIKREFQKAADIIGIDYSTATHEEQLLIQEMANLPPHHLEWFNAIGAWAGLTKVFH